MLQFIREGQSELFRSLFIQSITITQINYLTLINMISQIEQYFPQDPHQKRCGVYIRNPRRLGINYQRALVPLRHIDYQLEIVNSLLNITLSQKYFNPTEKFLEVEYSLPINPESSIYKFQVEFNNVKIEGIVKGKEEAKQQYDKAISEGKQAALGTIDPDSKDILNLEIGNIPPNTEFTVIISLLQQIKISMNTFYRVQIPATISPRYLNHAQKGAVKVPQHMKNKGQSSGKPDFDWSFKVDLKTTRKVTFFDSPSHNITLLNQNEKGTQTLLVMQKSQKPNKDFIFVYTTEDFQLPSYVLGNTDTSSTVMLSFIPKFCNLDVTDAYKASVQNTPFETDMAAAKGDYVFFLDRSGSMGGYRIEKAKEALVLFLKSLPQDSYFNIISFGSGSEKMFPKSEKNASKKIQEAVKKVKGMSANMGGTEIYNPLMALLGEKVIQGYPRQVFLLTDGGVSNTQGVVNMVKKSTKYCRVHSIGIGNGASYDLIQGCAEGGKGRYIMIDDNENPAEKIIELLQATLTPIISKVSLKYEKENQIDSIVPNPKSIPYILKDQIVNFFITFKGPLTEKRAFDFEYEDSVTKLPYKTSIEVDPDTLNQPFVNKMAHLKVLRSLQNSAKLGVTIEDQMFYVKVKDYKQEAIDYSVRHQVLSEYTAFICVGRQLVDGEYQQYKNKGVRAIHVQQPEPIQYQQEQAIYRCKMSSSSSRGRGGNANLKMKKAAVPLAMSMARVSSPVLQKSAKMPQKQSMKSANFMDSVSSAITSSISGLFSGSSKKRSMLAKKSEMMEQKFEKQYVNEQQDDDMMEGLDFQTATKKQSVEIQIRGERKEKQKEKKQDRKKDEKKGKVEQNKKTKKANIDQIVQLQAANGSWDKPELIQELAKNAKQVIQLASKLSPDVVITKLVILWMQKHHPEKQYALIVKKGLAWLKKALLEKGLGQESLNLIQCL